MNISQDCSPTIQLNDTALAGFASSCGNTQPVRGYSGTQTTVVEAIGYAGPINVGNAATVKSGVARNPCHETSDDAWSAAATLETRLINNTATNWRAMFDDDGHYIYAIAL